MAVRAASARGPTRRDGPRSARVLSTEQAAWLAAIPAAALTLVALVLLGPPLARLLFPPVQLSFWPEVAQGRVHPEEVEHARYVLALAAPLLLVLLTLLLRRRPVAFAHASRATTLVQALGLLVVVTCFVAQWTYVFRRPGIPGIVIRYFSARSLIVAAAFAVAAVLATRSASLRARWPSLTTGSRKGSAVAWCAAVVLIVVTVLPAIQTDGGVAGANQWVLYHLQFTFDEAAAVLNGLAPLHDFATQYSSLWPYVLAAGMSVFGSPVTSFTVQLAVLSGIALLAVYDVLRRVTHSAIGGLLLFVPVMATATSLLEGSRLVDRYSMVTYYGSLPMRYAGPFALAWLLTRQLQRAPARRRWWALWLVAGLVVVNNLDFGVPAAVATAIAAGAARGPMRASRLAREAATGGAAAFALVAGLLLLRTGSLPDLSLLTRYARVFLGGFSLIPIQPAIGLSTLIFLTYVAAIGAGAVRTIDAAENEPLSGLLLWSGVFGLGAASYYVGHSTPEKLIQQFPAWAFALSLLTVLVVRRLAAGGRRLPTPAELVCLFGFGLLVCSIAQTPLPWSQLQRLDRHGRPPLVSDPLGAPFVAAQTRPHEPVLVLTTLGHRTAEVAGARDVEPYTGALSIQTEEQLAESLGALREAGGSKVFLRPDEVWSSELQILHDSYGFAPSAEDPATQLQLWVRR